MADIRLDPEAAILVAHLEHTGKVGIRPDLEEAILEGHLEHMDRVVIKLVQEEVILARGPVPTVPAATRPC